MSAGWLAGMTAKLSRATPLETPMAELETAALLAGWLATISAARLSRATLPECADGGNWRQRGRRAGWQPVAANYRELRYRRRQWRTAGGLVGVNERRNYRELRYWKRRWRLEVGADVGGLVGTNLGRIIAVATIAASYGFGGLVAGVGNRQLRLRRVDRADDADESIHSPAVLTATNSSTTPANRWNTTVWDFGNDRLYPVVKWVTGYDATAGNILMRSGAPARWTDLRNPNSRPVR